MKKLILSVLFVFLFSSFALAEDVTLSWTAPDDDRVTGYNIYYGETGSEFKSSVGVAVDGHTTTSVDIADLSVGASYSFAATSRDAEGNESAFSDTIEYTVVSEPAIIRVPDRPKEMRIYFE